MAIYSYKMPRDYGFAPNPFYGTCTLATCKPDIRKGATLGDWVLGFGSKKNENEEKLIYAMRVDKKITFDEYWHGADYQCKKPVMNGSLKQNYGDNIYHHNKNGEWEQVDSHHSSENGEVNKLNLSRDTSCDAVLLSTYFWYFGRDAIAVPEKLGDLIPRCRNYIKQYVSESPLDEWLESLPGKGFISEPAKFSEEFKRYDGK